MQGVVYRETDLASWDVLEHSPAPVLDHFSRIGIDVVIDKDEGYAYLRSKPEIEGEDPLPRLIHRRTQTYPVSLLLVLLRKRMVEFETSGSEGRLVLSTLEIVEMMKLFQAESTNEVRLSDIAQATIKKVAELGFLRKMRGEDDRWEVLRILKAYVSAEVLADFVAKLQQRNESAIEGEVDAD